MIFLTENAAMDFFAKVIMNANNAKIKNAKIVTKLHNNALNAF